jgi:pseudouridine synthase
MDPAQGESESKVERLHKFLSECGVASRRASERLITEGRVTVNGVVAQIGQSVDPAKDRVKVDGKPVKPADTLVYVLLNKPKGTVTSAKDTRNRRTVVDCVKDLKTRVFPVGRLDIDVEGAVLLTNDGELAYRLMHPSHGAPKVYQAWVAGKMTPETAQRIEGGVMLEDGMSAPAKAEILHTTQTSTLVQLTLYEGRNHEVKRLCMAVGHPVKHLKRVAVGNIRIRGLNPGQWRHLTDREVKSLKELVGLATPPRQYS